MCAFLVVILIMLLFMVCITAPHIEKVVVPKHINLREDLYVIIRTEDRDLVKVIYYKKRQ